MLHVGWGSEAYRGGIAERWPQLGFDHLNPFSGPDHSLKMLLAFAEEGNAYGAVILSGLLACCSRGEVRRVLEKAAAALVDGGILAIHDTLLPVNELPPPEVVLGGLGRHIHQGGCRTWSVERLEENLVQLGLGEVKVRVLPAATVLVTALRGTPTASAGSEP